MEIQGVLESLGLNKKEAEVYLALLELGTASVQGIAQKAGVKRPTTYLILDDLQVRGLASEVPQSKKALYTAESPEYLASEVRRKDELLKRFLPDLLAVYNAKKDKPRVQLFPGREGARQIYQKTFEAGEVWFFGTTRDLGTMYFEDLQKWLDSTKQKKVTVRDLLARSKQDTAYAAEAAKGLGYTARFLPSSLDFPTDSAIFGDNIVFFSFRPQIFAVMITSREVAQSMRALYELAWRSAESI
jgi:HTH-type transcriptional regulator, sugar sensing transcriptional regulator